MKNLILCFLVLIQSVIAQMAPQSLPEFEHLEGQNYLISWESVPGRVYFIQTSSSLRANQFNWEYAPDIRMGTGFPIDMGFKANAANFEFFRLVYTDYSGGLDPNLADFDGDGYTNLEEAIANSDPFDAQFFPGNNGQGVGGANAPPSEYGTTWNHPWEYTLTLEVNDHASPPDVINPDNPVSSYAYSRELGHDTKITFKDVIGKNSVTFLDLEPNPNYDPNDASSKKYNLEVVELSAQNPEWSHTGQLSTPPGGNLLPVDLDIVHPATGELADGKEDQGDGGYVSIKREVEGEDKAPVTQLKIHKIAGAQNDWKTRLKFNAGDRYKIYKDEARTQLVTSEQTEFPANEDTILYFQGEKKSQSRGGEEITMQVGINGDWHDGDSVKCTVVQSDFPIDLRIFIPYSWVNIPHPLHLDEVAEGDSRNFDPKLTGTYRVSQSAILNPFLDLSAQRLRESSKDPGTTKHFDEDEVVNYEFGAKHSEDVSVKPSFIPHTAVPTNSGKSNLDRVETKFLGQFSNQTQAMIEFEGAAAEPIILGAADIDWQLRVGVEIGNPLNPTYFFSGKHDGFPAYEIYINSNHSIFPVTEVLQWKPALDKGVLELTGDADTFLPGIPFRKINQ